MFGYLHFGISINFQLVFFHVIIVDNSLLFVEFLKFHFFFVLDKIHASILEYRSECEFWNSLCFIRFPLLGKVEKIIACIKF